MSLRVENGLITPIRAICQDILSNDQMKNDDNFFQLGGDSLGIAELAARILETLDVEVDDVTILENPTPLALAAVLLQESDDADAVLNQLPDDEVELLIAHLENE